MVKIQIRSLSYINDRRRERIGSSFAQVKSYPDSKISFWTVSQDTYFLAQEVKDSPDLSSVFQTIRNNLTLLKTLSEKERIDKEHLEIFLARIKIEIMIGIEQREDRSDAIQLFSIFHSIFGNYEPEKVFSAYAGKEEKSIISRMVGKTSPFLDGSAQNSVIEDRAEMDGISNKSYSDGSDSGESHLGKEHKSVVEQSEDAQNRIEDLYFLAQYINEQLIKGNSDKLESQIDRLRTLSESVTNDLESAKPSIKDFYNLHIRQLVDNLFMDYEKK